MKKFTFLLATVSSLLLVHAGAQSLSDPFVQNGLVVTTPGAVGTYNLSHFTDTTTGYTVTIMGAGPVTLNNTDSIVEVGAGSAVTIGQRATLNNTGRTVYIDGGGTINNSGVVTNTGGDALYIGGANAAVNTIVSSGMVTAETNNALDIEGTDSGVNSITNSGTIMASQDGIHDRTNGSDSTTVLNTGSITSTTDDGIDIHAEDATTGNRLTNTGAIQADDEGLILFGQGSLSNVVVNSGPITSSGYGIHLEGDDAGGNSLTNSGTIVAQFDDGIHFDADDTGTNTLVNMGNVTSNGDDGIDYDADDSTSNTLTNSGIVNGDDVGLEFRNHNVNGMNAVINTGVAIGGNDGVEFQGNNSNMNSLTNSGVIRGGNFGVDFTGTGATSNMIVNSGLISSSGNGAGINLEGTTAGSDTITLRGGEVDSDGPNAIEITAGSNVTVNVVGRALLNGAINNDGATGVINLNLVGLTPAERTAFNTLKAANTTAGTITIGNDTYTFNNLLLGGSAISLELMVDSGLNGIAVAIDQHAGNLPAAFDPVLAAGATDAEGALNKLVGREIDNAIDVNEVNQGTQLAYRVNNHLDAVSRQVGGFDMSDFHVGTASEFAFMDTKAELNSLLGAPLGGMSMSTDKDMKQMSPAEEPRWGAWAAGTVTFADQSTSSIPGYQATTGSPTLGLDYRLSPNTVIGALVSYNTTGANFGDDSRLGVETGIFGLYGRWQQNRWHVNALISGGYTSYDIDRATFGENAEAHPSGMQAVADATGGYDIPLGKSLNFTPELGLTYTYVGVDSYTEGQAGAFNLAKEEQDIDSLRTHLGGRLSASLPWHGVTFTPQLRASYYHEFMDDSRGVTTSLPGATVLGAFPVETQNPQRDFAMVGVGLDTSFTGCGLPMAVFLNYDVQVGQSDYTAHNIDSGLRVDF